MFTWDKPNLAPIDPGWGGGGGGGGTETTAPLISTLQSDAEIIQGQIESLRAWAFANDKDARSDRRRYWLLKIPAIIFAASTSALETFGFHSAVILVGVVSAVCVAIDAAYPGGLLHNIHRQASNEIFLLADMVRLEWEKITVEFRDVSNPEGVLERKARVQRILSTVQEEKKRINDYLTAAEASLDKKRNSAR